VKGAEKTRSPGAAAVATNSGTKWLRTALWFALASILLSIAVLRAFASSVGTATSSVRRGRIAALGVRRRPRVREVSVEVIPPKALRHPIPLAAPARVVTPAREAASAPQQEEPTLEQLLADIAPPLVEPAASQALADAESVQVEEHTETRLKPNPLLARPPFHEPALAQPATALQKPLVEEQATSVDETALQTPEPDAENASVASPVEEVCEIGIWRGYVKSRFYAGLIGSREEGIEFALAESLPVRLRGNGTPDRTGAAAEAHEALVNYLIESGWELEPARNGESWYSLRFRRADAPAESRSA
jgi:hypothetical protein